MPLGFGESFAQRQARLARQRAQFPELNGTDVDVLARVDSLRRQEGRPLTSFGQAAEDALIQMHREELNADPSMDIALNRTDYTPGPLTTAINAPQNSRSEFERGRREAEALRSGQMQLRTAETVDDPYTNRLLNADPVGALFRTPEATEEEKRAFLARGGQGVTKADLQNAYDVAGGVIGQGIKMPGSLRGLFRTGAQEAAESVVRRGATEAVEDVASGLTREAPPSASPSRRLFGLSDPQPGLSRFDRAMNSIKETLNIGVPEEEIATPIMRERRRAQSVVDSQAARMGAVADEVTRAFPTDKAGRITGLPGQPTIQDVAARLPQYEPYLSPTQKLALGRLQSEIAPFADAAKEQGLEFGSRTDVQDGGFYLPRGNADVEGAELPRKVGTGRGGAGGKGGYAKSATFDSMAEGIDAGYEYAPFRDAVQGYARRIGKDTLNKWAGEAFRATGLGETPSARLLRQEPALAAKKAALDRDLSRFRSLAKNLTDEQQARVERFLHDPASFDPDELRDFLDVVNPAGTVSPAQAQQALADTRRALSDLAPDWRRAMERARQTLRDQGAIGFPSLNGTTFPDEIANVANKYLNAEKKATGRRTEVLNAIDAFNGLLRGFRASADLSFMGIQGLLGAVRHPVPYAKALKVALQSLGDERAFSSFLQHFDDTARAAGRPDSGAWNALGNRLGGSATEFEIGRGVGRVGQAIREGDIPLTGKLPKVEGGLNPIRGSNRAFGTFGDTLRLLADDALYRAKSAGGKAVSESDMADIAHFGNIMTGFSEGKFLGEFGSLAEFAPRFFQSQLDLVGRAVTDRGIVGQEARRTLGTLIGVGTLLTVGANEARGKKTELLNPGSPNFLRIRDVAGQDISLFGPWDSLVRGIVKTAQGDLGYMARTKASPAVSLAWDYLTGESFMGERTRDNPQQAITHLLTQIVPFSLSGLTEGEGVTNAAIGATGLKATPLTPTDRVQEGEYEQLRGNEQFRATRAQAWKAIQEQAPKDIRGQLAGYDSYYDWIDALRDEYTKGATAEAKQKGIPLDTVPSVVNSAINRHPTVKAMAKAITYYENQWIEKNPDDAYRLWKKYEGKSYREEGYWQPTKAQRGLIIALRERPQSGEQQ